MGCNKSDTLSDLLIHQKNYLEYFSHFQEKYLNYLSIPKSLLIRNGSGQVACPWLKFSLQNLRNNCLVMKLHHFN